MKYLTTTFAIAFMAIGFAATPAQANETPTDEWGCPMTGGFDQTQCIKEEQLRREREYRQSEEGRPHRYRTFGEITDVDPLAETAQGGDRDGDVGGDDSGSDADRAAASTSAE